MSNDNHDTLVYRLAQILVKLNQGEKLDPQALADEFGVTLRTIQRDLNVRFAYLPLQKTEGRYHLDATYLGKLNTKDVERFAALAGISGLFPSLSDDFLRDIFDSRIHSALLVKGHHYEDLSGKESTFQELEKAIISRNNVSFEYAKSDGLKKYLSVSPYKLINNKGIWYLAAIDAQKLKTFSFSKIVQLSVLTSSFELDVKIAGAIDQDEGVWLSGEKQKITLKVNSEIAGYFKRRKLIANQIIETELSDGSLIISCEVGHANQILPIVQYWIPHLHILNPTSLQQEIENNLTQYLAQTKSRI
jgi:predicted DNA-binding transcriptional regulator YafY